MTYNIGDRVQVTEYGMGHNYTVGEIITISEHGYQSTEFRGVRNNGKLGNYLRYHQVKHISKVPPVPTDCDCRGAVLCKEHRGEAVNF